MARNIIANTSTRAAVLESVPVDPALLTSANWWFDISWYGLLIAGLVATIAAAATVIFLFVQFWSGGVRERHTEWRTSSLEQQTAQAKKDTALAQERIATLNKETARLSAEAEASRAAIAGANARAVEAQAALERFKAPRAIAESDKPSLIAALSKFAGTNAAIYVLGEGPEPNGLAISIRDVLTKARGDVLSWNWSGGGAATGVLVLYKAESGADIVATCNALATALNSAHIDSASEPWPGNWDQFGGMLNGPNPPAPTAAPIRIVVATKPQ